MMKNIKEATLFVWVSIFLTLSAAGQEVPVHAEILYDEQVLHIKSPSLSTFTKRRKVKILDREGEGYGDFFVQYDDEFHKLSAISFIAYDAQGNELKKLKKKDIEDISLTSSGIGDSRAKIAEFRSSSYPYTVEYSYTKELKDMLNLPTWYPQPGENLAVVRARLEVVNDALDLRYQAFLGAPEPDIQVEGASTRYVWEMKKLEAKERELYSGNYPLPYVLLSLSRFEMEKYVGEANSWQSLGKFLYQLNANRDKLPEPLAQKVYELTETLSQPSEKIAALYKYMQENTRYVSIQLGIGGWQTFPAEYVYEHGFGDCKALTNYMQSMLKEIGIASYPAYVYAGRSANDIQADFPSNQFNHVILCVPEVEDTTWLECTDSYGPSDYLGSFTDDRNVLLVTEEGGTLIRTPRSIAEENHQNRKATFTINKEGTATIQSNIHATGYMQDDLRQVHRTYSPRDIEDWLKDEIGVKNIELKSYALTPGQKDSYNLDYEIESKKYATASGPRLFLPLNKVGQIRFIPPKMEDRSQPIRLKSAFMLTDTVLFNVPQNLAVEALPKMPVEIETEFATYKANVEVQPSGQIIYTRYFSRKKMELPPEEYAAFREFYQKVTKADKVQMVLADKS